MPRARKMPDKKAVFVLVARNCAATLPDVLDNVARHRSLFAGSHVLFLENDSTDATRQIIAAWRAGQPDTGLITVEGLSGNPIRTLCLETVRNRAIAAVKADFADHDYLFLLDADQVNSAPLETSLVGRAVTWLEEAPDRVAAFANAGGTYFDMWALRHPTLCPGDIWEELMDYALANKVSDAEAYAKIFAPRLFNLAPDAPPLEVDSAFGGLGIYKIPAVLANPARYAGAKSKTLPAAVPGITGKEAETLGWQTCEHVSFHAGLRENGGRLFILPFLVNCRVVDDNFPPSAWRSFLFRAGTPQPGRAAAAAGGSPGRNQPCPCGSGERYKHCHGRL
jgi:hypothetical protein